MNVASAIAQQHGANFDNVPKAPVAKPNDAEAREAFRSFVGQTFFGQLMQQMRKTTGDNPYFNGGQAEKMFTAQLDQVIAEKMSDASASTFADPMYELFALNRR